MKFLPRQYSVKTILPSSLFGRALLILIIPTILVQVIAITIFYDRHWASIVRNMSASLAGEIALLVHEIEEPNLTRRAQWVALGEEVLGAQISFSGKPLERNPSPDPRFDTFRQALKKRIDQPFTVKQVEPEEDVLIRIALPDTVLEVQVTKKRLVSTTTLIFVLWVVGSATILMLIAIFFLRNQIRPISRLAKAAEGFGMGTDDTEFRPHGSKEVRQAGRAFINMKRRITRQIEARTAMLSGISHDLRTPLTRMKLELEMLPESDERQALQDDVAEMIGMVEAYLAFMRGEDGEMSEYVDMEEFLESVVKGYADRQQPVILKVESSVALPVKKQLLKRALDNCITNALRYGDRCDITVEASARELIITVEDTGPGIPESEHEMVFQPFKRLEQSRNLQTGGMGLGLTIVREAVQAHGGEIFLKNKLQDDEISGLQVIIRLPVPIQQ